MKVPFGKFKGWEVEKVPRDYLTWLWETCDLREPLRSAVEDALSNGGEEGALARSDLPPELKPVVRELVSAGYRSLAQRYHPDRGGRHEDMTRLNQAAEWLRKIAA